MKRNGSVHYKCHVSVCLLELIPKCENSNNFQTRNGSNGFAPFCLNLQKKHPEVTSRTCILVCGRTRFVLYISSCVPRHPRIRPRSTSETAIQKTGKTCAQHSSDRNRRHWCHLASVFGVDFSPACRRL